MADVYQYIIPTGTIIVEDAQTILTEVQQEFKNAFGQDLIVTPDTPQGVLITAETLSRIAVADNNATMANQINPNLAGGILLDAILALTGAERTEQAYTIVVCNFTGVAGTIIPQGALVRDSVDASEFALTSQVTLAIDGTGVGTFQAVIAGPLTVAINTLTQKVSAVLGWETCTNPAVQTIIGATTQSDASARLFRRNTLALQGIALPEAIISGLNAVSGVQGVAFRENISPTTQVIDGVTMVGHSIYVCVDGGTDTDVANILLNKKSAGAAYNNGASADPVDVLLIVPFSLQPMHILFDRPDLIPIIVKTTISASEVYTDPTNTVKTAILDYVNGLIAGEQGLTVGVSVSTFELAGAINIEAPGIFVHDLQISLASPLSWQYTEIPIAIFEKATLTASGITVTIV